VGARDARSRHQYALQRAPRHHRHQQPRDAIDQNHKDFINSFMLQLGVRTRSRLLEMCEWVEVQGADIRDVERVTEAAKTGQMPEPPSRLTKKGLPGKSRRHGSRQIEGLERPVRVKLVWWQGR
jgi:hypothetical protein